MSSLITVTVVLAILGSAVIGGVFFAFSSFIMKALARLPNDQGIAAMQSINVVVLNRAFLGTFVGTAALSLLLAGLAVAEWGTTSVPWYLAGAVSYLAAGEHTFGITAGKKSYYYVFTNKKEADDLMLVIKPGKKLKFLTLDKSVLKG